MVLFLCFPTFSGRVPAGCTPSRAAPAAENPPASVVCRTDWAGQKNIVCHDVIEDSNHTLEELSRAGFPNEVVQAVGVLTRDPHMHYLDYVAKVRRNPIARRVKLADLKRLENVTEQDKCRLLKYHMAQAILADDPYDASLSHFRKQLPLSLNEPVYLSVFYNRTGEMLKYSLDFEYAEDSHCEFSVDEGDKLRKELSANRTLPEALADMMPFSEQAFASLLEGIRTVPKPSKLFRW